MEPVSRVMQSYGRCCSSLKFFDDFYEHFLASSPAVREYFVNADFAAQKHLLRAGVLNLVLYARGMPDTKLRALGQSHSRVALDIKPELYDLWIEAFLRAVKEHDIQATDTDILAWREVLNKGISLIKSFY
ncbi:globin [Pseudomonas sp. GCM10022188]|uniref:globin n=1 Tax=Pseudomonas TaxID=286 RepID=UPI001E4EB2EB|nr:globin [Pseudomonas oryzagri]MCC6076050.1 globin [Pseudomonas oryzagri]